MGLRLTRKARETVSIGPDITVGLVWISEGEVRLNIEAPRSLVIGQGANLVAEPRKGPPCMVIPPRVRDAKGV